MRYDRWMPALVTLACVGFLAARPTEVVAGGGGRCDCPPPCTGGVMPSPADAAPVTPRPAESVPAPAARPGETPRPDSSPAEAAAPSTDLALDQRFAGVGGETASVPNMLGDFLGSSSLRCVPFQTTTVVPVTTTVQVPLPFCRAPGGTIFRTPINQPCPPGFVRLTRTSTVTTNTIVTVSQQDYARVPSSCHTFKIAEDQAVRPQNRVFTDYNYYSDVLPSGRIGSDTSRINVSRESVGVEKTFLDGMASVELHMPFYQVNIGGSTIAGVNGEFRDVGDLSVIFKGIIWDNRDSGVLLTGGLAVTTTTGPDNLGGISFTSGCVHSTLLQPYVGYLWASGRFYLHGFSALDIPTTSQDSVLMYNDVGVGYFVVRRFDSDRWLTAVVPTLEAHLTTPLSGQGTLTSPGFTPDMLDLTEGVTFGIGRRATLSLGVAEPVTGPKPFNVEGIAQVNIRY